MQRDPYGQALNMLKTLTLAGRFGWGEPLVVKDLSEEIGFSHTPVREALARMAGEGLIERRRGKGYFFPSHTAPDIIDLTDLDWAYVHAALTLHPPTRAALQKVGSQPADTPISLLCNALVRLSGSEALVTAYAGLIERMRPIERAEHALGLEHAGLSATLIRACEKADRSQVQDVLVQHHAGRCAAAADIAKWLQRGG